MRPNGSGVAWADPDRRPDEGEEAKARSLLARIDARPQEQERRIKAWEQNRRYWRGAVGSDGKPGLVRTNIVYSTMATILPQIYARSPDISVAPSPAVAESPNYDQVKRFAETMEVVLRTKFVEECNLKRIGKASVRAAMTCGVAWVKLVYQERSERDPLIQRQIEDATDNLNRAQMLQKRLRNPESMAENERTIEELKQTIAGLQERVDVPVQRGMIIDRPLSEDVIVLDDSVRDFDAYPRADAIAHRIWYRADDFERDFGFRPKGATEYGEPKIEGDTDHASRDSRDVFHCVFEVWSRADNRIYTLCKGWNRYIREPYSPQCVGERFYPFFALGFNLVDGQFYPITDVELLRELQDEYNTTRTNFAEHRKESLPVRIARAGGQLAPEDLDRLQNRKINEIVVISGASGRPLQEDLFEFPNIPIDANTYSTDPIRADIDMVSGATDAARGSVMKAKTATEAEILNAGLSSRTSERQDSIEDWLGDMARYAAQILMQKLSRDDVVAIAGQGAAWPEMSKDQIFSLVQIQVRAGSTGKPNAARDQERWLKLMPIIQDAMIKVAELRAAGQQDMADAVVELVRETLRRFDERIDLDEFIPPAADPLADMEGLPPEARAIVQRLVQQAQTQQAQMQAQMQAMQEQLQQATDQRSMEQAKLSASAEQANAEMLSRQAIEQARAGAASQQAAAKLQMDHEAAMDEAARREAIERERIASNERIAIAKAQADARAKIVVGQLTRGGAPAAEDVVEGELEQEVSGQTAMPTMADIVAQMQSRDEAMLQAVAALATGMQQGLQRGFEELAQAVREPLYPQRGKDGLIQSVTRGSMN